MNVYIGEPKTITVSDMQWPAPDWFHIPLQTEWQWLKTIMDWLGLTTWDTRRINLHMPFAGLRDTSSASIGGQGSYGYYWSSSPYVSDQQYARYLNINSSNVTASVYNARTLGFSVRCFKNSFEKPTSSWTIIYGTLGWAWIFWNQTEWIISITSNGATWYTIQDKNLWATSVYNNGDTLSEANCGKYYQRWNNYWFAWTWSVTTSSTQVNAQNYWPWNYYSGSTFITWNNDWSSVHNDNLRWWISQWTSTKTVSQELKNAYIWEYVPNFATQWPCASWFHVPLQTEWQWLKTIMDWLGLTTWDGWKINLHMPFAWHRDFDYSGRVLEQWQWGDYWSWDGTTYSGHVKLYPSVIEINNSIRWPWFSVRWFKNTFVLPTASWTVINGTLWWSWIFRNQIDWLISITSDWTTWYTIQDKNLWATTVYNDWDTLSEANCWKYYQWWNNYGFAWTWSVTASNTQINASWYWPWNYYSSSTYIYWYYDWSSVTNDNLRWWEDWNVPV